VNYLFNQLQIAFFSNTSVVLKGFVRLQQLDALEEVKVYLLLQARAGIRHMVLEV
jgi:hypothetical protein